MDEPGDTTTARPIRVVIIDDHEMLLESLRRLLAEDPAIDVVATATTASSGIELAREHAPDIVIIDLVLPDLDGAEATRRMLAERPELRVVILTGSDRAGGYYAAMEAGCSAWVRKTRAVHDLVETVHDVFSGQRMVRDETLELPAVEDLVVHYQPILDLSTQHIIGFEGLVRWNHPQRGLLGPAMFLPNAEETGFIIDLDAFVSQQAVHDLLDWQRRFGRDLFVSVNMSPSELNRADLTASKVALLESTGIEPHDLIFEVTETAILEDTPIVAANLDALKTTGVRLALDDFGTAFSSLALVRRFPFDHIKIDQTFVAELPNTPRSVLLLEAVHNLADSLGMGAIAEGIERVDQLECLLGIGWTLGQGYLFSRPVPAAKIDALLS